MITDQVALVTGGASGISRPSSRPLFGRFGLGGGFAGHDDGTRSVAHHMVGHGAEHCPFQTSAASRPEHAARADDSAA